MSYAVGHCHHCRCVYVTQHDLGALPSVRLLVRGHSRWTRCLCHRR